MAKEVQDEWAISSRHGYYSSGGDRGGAYYFETAPLYAARMSKSKAEATVILIAARHPELIGTLNLIRWNQM